MSPEGSRNFAETMFKRIWHRGFKGRFAYFRWNTDWSDAFDNVPGIGEAAEAYFANYNVSEHRAWTQAGPQLRAFVQRIPNGYTKNIAAHSMGNIVAGSALARGMRINNYAMMQAVVRQLFRSSPNPAQDALFGPPPKAYQLNYYGFLSGKRQGGSYRCKIVCVSTAFVQVDAVTVARRPRLVATTCRVVGVSHLTLLFSILFRPPSARRDRWRDVFSGFGGKTAGSWAFPYSIAR